MEIPNLNTTKLKENFTLINTLVELKFSSPKIVKKFLHFYSQYYDKENPNYQIQTFWKFEFCVFLGFWVLDFLGIICSICSIEISDLYWYKRWSAEGMNKIGWFNNFGLFCSELEIPLIFLFLKRNFYPGVCSRGVGILAYFINYS